MWKALPTIKSSLPNRILINFSLNSHLLQASPKHEALCKHSSTFRRRIPFSRSHINLCRLFLSACTLSGPLFSLPYTLSFSLTIPASNCKIQQTPRSLPVSPLYHYLQGYRLLDLSVACTQFFRCLTKTRRPRSRGGGGKGVGGGADLWNTICPSRQRGSLPV